MRRTLILVDVQNGFLHNADNQVMVQKIHQLLNEQLFDRVIATRYVNTAGSNIIRLMGWDKLLTAAEQTIPPEILEHVDYVDEKIGYSGYTDTMRKFLLQDNGDKYPEEIFLAGLDLGCCVLETATDFFEAGGGGLLLPAHFRRGRGGGGFLAAPLLPGDPIGAPFLVTYRNTSTQEQK